MRKKTSLILPLILITAAVPFLLVRCDMVDRWEHDLFDIFSRAGAEDSAQSDLIRIVMIDNVSLEWGAGIYLRSQEGSGNDELTIDPSFFNWPWDRFVYDLIILYLESAGARVVAFDMDFSSPPPRGTESSDESFGGTTCVLNGTALPFVIHALNFTLNESGVKEDRSFSSLEQACLEGGSITIPGRKESGIPFDRTGRGWYGDPILPYRGILTPFKNMEHLIRLGMVCVTIDADSVIRRTRPFALHSGKCYPSLGLAAAQAYIEAEEERGSCEIAVEKNDLVVRRTESGKESRLPLTPAGDILIKWRDNGREDPNSLDAGYFRTYPAHRVLRAYLREHMQEMQLPPEIDEEEEPGLDPAVFKDKIVFVGSNATSLHDLKATPVSSDYPGVKIHAALTEGILEGETIGRLGIGTRSLLAGLLALAVILLTLHSKSGLIKIASLLGLSSAYVAAAVWLFLEAGLWIDVVTPILGTAVAYTSGTTWNYFTEGRKSREISSLFQHFAPPHVVKQLIADPANLQTRGTNTDITVFFSDIQSFTTLSNSPEMRRHPERLTDHLNHYLSEMTRAIKDCNGTLDKYIGDAVVAFFGAPLHLENHARDACRAALVCRRRLAVFNDKAIEKGLPPFVTRIGLYSGEATVGCVGSRERYSYTAIGSPVNFASRLEGANKVFGTLILAGAPTIERAGETVRARFLDRVRVPGISNDAPPLELFTLLEEEDSFPPDAREGFEKAYELYQKMRFQEASRLFERLATAYNDNPSKAFMKRCLFFTESQPDKGWDGVYRIESK